MSSISFEELATIIFVLVDDWYQIEGVKHLQGKVGRKPVFSDSEVITLLLLMDYLPFPGENQFLGFIRANYLALFPKLVDQSQFNRRVRNLRFLVEEMRRSYLGQLGYLQQTTYLLDTKPVPVVGYKRSKRHSEFAETAAYGYCASRNFYYFGYKLVVLITLDGIPIAYDLVAANTDERVAAEAVLCYVTDSDIIGDKGFISEEWQAEQFAGQGNRIWTPKRKNQHEQNPPDFDRFLNGVRERVESLFNEVQNTGRNIERLLRKTVQGLAAHMTASMTSHLFKVILRQQFNIDVQTFSYIA